MVETHPLPKALQLLILDADKKLKELQQHLMGEIHSAALELMELQNLSPKDGWAIDIDQMVYLRNVPDDTNQSELSFDYDENEERE